MELLTQIQKLSLGDLFVLILAAIKVWDIAMRLIKGITCQHDEKQELQAFKDKVITHDREIAELRREHAKDRAFLAGKISELSDAQNRYQSVSLLTKIFGYWKSAKEQGYVTPYDLKMFSECIKEFETKKSGDPSLTMEVEKYRDEFYALQVKE